MKKLTIGLFNDSFPPIIDGVSIATYNYARCIHKNHGKAFVATPAYPNIKDEHPFKVVRYPSFDAGSKIGYRIGNPLSPGTLKKIIKEKPDILHVHCPFASGLLGRFARQYTKKPIIFTYHTKFNIDIEKRVGLAGLRFASIKLVLNNINAADEVWVVSKGAGENLQSLGYKGKYIVMDNGTDFDKRRASEEIIRKLKEHHKITEDETVFAFVGRLMWYKNLKFTIDALVTLANLGYKFKMIFIGEGHDRKEMQKYVAEKGIGKNCIFTGAIRVRENLREYFSITDLFLFPSTYDTNGLVVREAAACSVPSVVIKDSCAAESITDPESGILIEENHDHYVEILVKACQNKDMLKQMGIMAAEHVYLSWDDAIAKAYARYETFLSSK